MGLLQRKLAREEPFPKTWRQILRRNVPFYARLTKGEKKRFEDKLKVFVWTKHWIAGGAMKIDDEVKVVIAAGAARLALNVEGEDYAKLTEIVVYENAWNSPRREDDVVLGEAHWFGTVVLSWKDVLLGIANETDGRDVSLHEFAHVLDRADGAFDGTPVLPRFAYAPWVAALSRDFLRLRAGKKSVIRRYGATNEAEFFAVATEAFFEKPLALREKHAALYDVLADYYGQDPAREADKRRAAERTKRG